MRDNCCCTLPEYECDRCVVHGNSASPIVGSGYLCDKHAEQVTLEIDMWIFSLNLGAPDEE